MKVDDVRILPALDPGDSYTEPNFLLVETFRNKKGEAVTSMEHVSGKATGKAVGWEIKSLGAAHLSHLDAMQWAIAYAAMHGIPVIYERDETATLADTLQIPSLE